MKALKDNKVYTISEKEKAHYIALGFDIQDDEGKVIAHGQGKTVPYEQYAELEAEHEKLIDAYKAKDEPSEVVLEALKEYAQARQIDIGQATSQNGILKKIKEAKKE